MAVLVRRRLDKTHRGKVTRACRVPEIGQIVLMFRLVGLSDHVDRSWRQVMGIGRLLVILKRLMVRNIVERRETSHGSVIGSADRRAVRVPSSGRKPPWNHPQVMPFSLSRSPIFLPVSVTRFLPPVRQSSRAGRGLPIMVPSTTCVFRLPVSSTTLSPWVWPEIRLTAPGVDGPNVVSKKLSLMAKCWA